MANSKYEYVKSFEVEDKVMPRSLILVRVQGRDFQKFSESHNFEKPNDARALDLMNSCAIAVLEEYPDIVFSYGFGDEYSFVFKKTSKFYQRRASKLQSLIVSFFSSAFATKWKTYFPQTEMKYPPSFQARVMCCISIDVLQTYLAWRQNDCYTSNLYNTCLSMLIKSGKTIDDAREILKCDCCRLFLEVLIPQDTQKQEKNELLFQQFGINYKKLPELFRHGSCLFKAEVEDIVKYDENGTPIKRLRRKPRIIHTENVAGINFWNQQPILLKELGSFKEEIHKIDLEDIEYFVYEPTLMPSTWVVIRIDGCHFHRFAEVHEFEKPNDKQALNLMNSCAVAVLEEFQDIIFSYGVSDEYSFVLRKSSCLYQRRASQIVSAIVSFFSSLYTMKWKEFFPLKQLKYPSSFDGRAVCYPSSEILRDYLSWRQVDCHINNQYNTCFWMLVKSGKTKAEAQRCLKHTQTKEKNELLIEQFNIEYNTLPIMFRHGSYAFRVKKEKSTVHENEAFNECSEEIVLEHNNIIEQSFWKAHPDILEEFL